MKNRVLMVSMTPFFGGGEAFCVKLAKVLEGRYELGAAIADPHLSELLGLLGIPVWALSRVLLRVPVARYPGAALVIARAIREFKPDVVHLNGQSENYFARIPWSLGVPAISIRHTNFDASVSSFKRYLAARSLRAIEKTVCVSSMLKQQLSGVVDERKLTVIQNWIDPLPQASTYIPPKAGEPFRLLYVGRLVRDKGIFDLIEAVRKVENVLLTVVGDGTDSNEVRVSASGLPIKFEGFHADCSSFYQKAHLLVFPSFWEGHPLVPIEAMAHGLPCLLSDIPVNRETADHEQAAELFECGNTEDLAAKIRSLQNDSSRLLSLSEYGVCQVQRHYTKNQAMERYFKVFDEAIATH